jgi:hypothetical protein
MISWFHMGQSVSPLEQYGLDLVSDMIRRLRQSGFQLHQLPRPPEGPHFEYDSAPGLFCGRQGRGPLHVAWDTNLLIDYFDHGARLWSGESLPAEIPGNHGEELEGLQLVVTLWVLRDIRFHVPRFFLADSKRKPLSKKVREQRLHAMRQFARAVEFVADGEGSDAPVRRPLHPAEHEVMKRVPAGNDRVLVQEALRSGMDVFMTRDTGILAARPALRVLGMVVASPLDLVEELAVAGALHCLLDPKHLYWPMPDQQRVMHLIEALQT